MSGHGVAEVGAAVDEVAAFACSWSWSDADTRVRAAVSRVVFDSVVVTIAGGNLAEAHRRRASLPSASGPATVFGADQPTAVSDAAWHNGCSMVALELDEGDKRIRGHASAHVLPAALAVAEARAVRGPELATAFVVGHEVASRFGAATVLHPGVHPHGTWGATGAAAAVARLHDADRRAMAAAIDAATALAHATSFDVATDGLPVRDGWVGAANTAGIWAWTLADPVRSATGVGANSLGRLLGTLDPAVLRSGFGDDLAIVGGYMKRHASCSYTHPPADAALALREQRAVGDGSDIDIVVVESHHLAARLHTTTWPTRLAAMFSVPYVVATALLAGHLGPEQFDDEHRADPQRARLASRVRLVHDPAFDRRLPQERAARVTVRWSDGSTLAKEVANPVGDSDGQPLSDEDLRRKAISLLGSADAVDGVHELVTELLVAGDVRRPMAELRALAARMAGQRGTMTGCEATREVPCSG
jgi:2-methylcitrate dehydratase PrpD